MKKRIIGAEAERLIKQPDSLKSSFRLLKNIIDEEEWM